MLSLTTLLEFNFRWPTMVPGEALALTNDIKGYLAKGLNLTAVAILIACNRQTLVNWIARNGELLK